MKHKQFRMNKRVFVECGNQSDLLWGRSTLGNKLTEISKNQCFVKGFNHWGINQLDIIFRGFFNERKT